jgi:hypothetical protein
MPPGRRRLGDSDLPAWRPSGSRGAGVYRGGAPVDALGTTGGQSVNSRDALGRRIDDLYPWIYAPGSAFPLSLYSPRQTVNNGVTVNLITQPPVGRGSQTRFTAFGVGASDTTVLAWTFLVGGRPTAPITAIVFPFGAISSPTPIPGPGVIIRPGEDFILQVTNTGVAPVTVVEARVDGYTWTSVQIG